MVTTTPLPRGTGALPRDTTCISTRRGRHDFHTPSTLGARRRAGGGARRLHARRRGRRTRGRRRRRAHRRRARRLVPARRREHDRRHDGEPCRGLDVRPGDRGGRHGDGGRHEPRRDRRLRRPARPPARRPHGRHREPRRAREPGPGHAVLRVRAREHERVERQRVPVHDRQRVPHVDRDGELVDRADRDQGANLQRGVWKTLTYTLTGTTATLYEDGVQVKQATNVTTDPGQIGGGRRPPTTSAARSTPATATSRARCATSASTTVR